MSDQHKNENEMKLHFHRRGLSVGSQKFKAIRASQIKVNWQLSKWDSWRPLSDHNVGSNTQSARLKCLTNTRSQQSVYSKIRHSNELQLIDSCQTTASGDHHHLNVSRAQVSTHWVRAFLRLSCWQVTTFQMIAGSSSIFLTHRK